MLAVSNTSPISNLASIGRLDLLPLQFDSILIPEAVEGELAAHPDQGAKAFVRTALDLGWLQVFPISDSPILKVLRSQLHAGEAEAIALALEKKAPQVLIDEKEGRQVAVHCGLSVTGALGVLLAAKERGHITQIRPELEKLRVFARFFVAPGLAAKILLAADEA